MLPAIFKKLSPICLFVSLSYTLETYMEPWSLLARDAWTLAEGEGHWSVWSPLFRSFYVNLTKYSPIVTVYMDM